MPSLDEYKLVHTYDSWALFSLPKNQKIFKILCHIESCGICMEY